MRMFEKLITTYFLIGLILGPAHCRTQNIVFSDSFHCTLPTDWGPFDPQIISIQENPYLLHPIRNQAIPLDSKLQFPVLQHGLASKPGKKIEIYQDKNIRSIIPYRDVIYMVTSKLFSFQTNGEYIGIKKIKVPGNYYMAESNPVNPSYYGQALFIPTKGLLIIPVKDRSLFISDKKSSVENESTTVALAFSVSFNESGIPKKIKPFRKIQFSLNNFPEKFFQSPLSTAYFLPNSNGNGFLMGLGGSKTIYSFDSLLNLNQTCFPMTKSEFQIDSIIPSAANTILKNYYYGPLFQGTKQDEIVRFVFEPLDSIQLNTSKGLNFQDRFKSKPISIQICNISKNQKLEINFPYSQIPVGIFNYKILSYSRDYIYPRLTFFNYYCPTF